MHLHRATWLPLIIIAAVAVGGLLYLYGGPAFHQSYLNGSSPFTPQPQAGLTVLAQGDAAGMDTRVNYRIQTRDQMSSLWQMLYTDSGQPVPNVDFSQYEVLALFDGSHSTGGYGIQLTSLKDSDSERTVTITHIEPGPNCAPPSGVTSPFVIVQVPKSSNFINRIEQTYVNQC